MSEGDDNPTGASAVWLMVIGLALFLGVISGFIAKSFIIGLVAMIVVIVACGYIIWRRNETSK